jgi:hypothetical protein
VTEIVLAVAPCRSKRPYCLGRSSAKAWVACWACLGNGTHAVKPGRPEATWEDTTPVQRTLLDELDDEQ